MNHRLTHAGITLAFVAVLVTVSACVTPAPEEPIFRLVPVSSRDINVDVTAAGSVEPIMTVEVRSKASGEIFELHVEVGDAVRAGALLLRVDPRVPEAQLRQAVADSVLAQAQYETAQSQLRRTEALHESQSITEVEFEDARLAVASARASLVRAARSLEDARISAEDTEVRAPLTGVVIDKRVEEGTVITSATGASAGSVLMQMANLDTVQFRSLVDETDIGRIEPGLQVTIRVDAYPNRPFRGRVLKIEPQAEVTSNVTMFPVLVRIANEEGLLRPGMNGEVEISIGRRRGAVAVPNNALRTMRDFMSAASVLELDPQVVREQLAGARPVARERGAQMAEGGTPPAAGDSGRRGMRWMESELPEGVSQEQVREILGKRRTDGEESLTQEERALLEQIGFTGRPPVGMNTTSGPSGAPASSSNDPLAADYIVFVKRDSVTTAVRIRTGLSDGEYSEVLEGLSEGDTLIVIPSTGRPSEGGPGGMRGMGRGMGPPRL